MPAKSPCSSWFVALLLFAVMPVQAAVSETVYAPFQALLNQYLIEQTLPGNGLVSAFDYSSAAGDARTDDLLRKQRQALAGFDPAQLKDREESVAFWINAYNFFMIDKLLSDRPAGQLVSSVWDYGGRINPFVDSVFEREMFNVGGRSLSLDGIEKGILLSDDYKAKGWKDARVHFAVNCASTGCPPLRKQVYTAPNLDSLLADNTRRALNTPRHLTVNSGELFVTELFNWYEDDFVEAEGSIRAFILKWAAPARAQTIRDARGLRFSDYEWLLNRPKNFPELQ
ncbi:MAG: DUF547 domain-containing protein [Marinobacter sp.]|uniref:DUF547 domain-containing protein n=1 Tax=unclassified Marinobacter TaxID=83889 RepID=UPI00273C103B|nr:MULTISPECIES: DUF547 domain-containing protein [unclassified Marinobacter]MDP4547961.1 DUF547 domain-containing protein [Marinobacter sp. MDS2]